MEDKVPSSNAGVRRSAQPLGDEEMWSRWQVALCAGAVTGLASVFSSLGRGAFDVLVFAVVISTHVFVATWLGARVSRRTLLSPKAALALVAGLATAIVFVSLPIGTHAVVYSQDVESAQSVFLFRFYVFGAAISIIPAVATFAVFRTLGSPPKKSLERTREG